MKIEMDYKGIEDLAKAFEAAASDDEIKATNKKIVQRGEQVVKKIMSKNVPKSADISKSGRWEKAAKIRHVPSKHAADSVPVGSVKTKGTGAYAEVGWDKSDNSEHFYVKFINWGTIRQPPREFIYKSGREADGELQKIAEEEYKAFLEKTIGE